MSNPEGPFHWYCSVHRRWIVGNCPDCATDPLGTEHHG